MCKIQMIHFYYFSKAMHLHISAINGEAQRKISPREVLFSFESFFYLNRKISEEDP